MAITRLNTSSLTGVTIPNTSINNASLNSVTALPSGVDVGKIGQVLQGQNNTQISTSISNNDQDVVTQSITPTATSSKILIVGTIMGIQTGTGSSNTRWNLKIFRDTTEIMTSGANRWDFTTNYERDGGFSIQWYDTPSSTSAINYRLTSNWSDTGGDTCYVNKDGNSGYSTITLMEVLA